MRTQTIYGRSIGSVDGRGDFAYPSQLLKTHRLAAFGAAFFVLAFSSAAAAEPLLGPSCNPRDKVLSHLATKYSEAPVAVGVTSSGALLEVLSTDEGTTWTVILTRPDGVSCLLAAGESWQPLSPSVSEKEGDPI